MIDGEMVWERPEEGGYENSGGVEVGWRGMWGVWGVKRHIIGHW